MTIESIPRVRDIEYLSAFLNGVAKGGLKRAEDEVCAVRMKFEEDKDKALGKGRRMKKIKCHSMAMHCLKMCKQMHLVNEENGKIVVKEEVEKIIRDRRALLDRFLRTYSSFRRLLFKIRGSEKGKIYATLVRGERWFRKSVKPYDIDIKQWTFEMVRDLGTQLEVLNWRELDPDEVGPQLGTKGCMVYLVANIVKLSELQELGRASSGFHNFCIRSFVEDLAMEDMGDSEAIVKKAISKAYLVFRLEDDYLFIKNFEVEEEDFERALWREYLRITDRVPRAPVYYPKLKDRICEKLRLSDKTFDIFVQKMLESPNNYKLRIYPGGGTLPRHLSRRRKNIPPRFGYDSFMVYLKIDKAKEEKK